MGRKHSKTSAIRIKGAERHLEALRYREAGLTFRQIGERMGFSAERAYKIITDELMKLNAQCAESADAVTRLELNRLDGLWLVAWAKARDKDMRAADTCLRIMERRARLLGLDAPTRSEVRQSGGLTITASELSDDELAAVVVAEAKAEAEPEEGEE